MSADAMRVVSGIQPTGDLHLGNLLGAILRWVRMQDEAECLYFLADLHALTVYVDPAELHANIREMAAALIASGIDPKRSLIYRQSAIPAHAELTWILSGTARMGWLNRMTQWKDKAGKNQEGSSVGLFSYPVLQAADILLYRAELVPVGEDQLQHLELSREIARKWNARFDAPAQVFFPEPKGLLTPTRRVMGLDGQAKMSKSLGNTVEVLEDPKSIWEKLRPAVTDPKRVRRTDPGTPEVCNIYHLHKAFSTPETVEHVAVQCRTAGWGCIDCKKVLHESMEKELAPIRARAKEIAANPQKMKKDLAAGAAHARSIAADTMTQVKTKMGLA